MFAIAANVERTVDMKIFTYVGKGLALGSVVVVVGIRESNARRAAEKWCKENGVDPKTLQLAKTDIFHGGAQIVHAWNGDY
jgi:hypothetical protein